MSYQSHGHFIVISRYVDSLPGLCQSSTDFIQGNHRQQSLLAIYLASYLNTTSRNAAAGPLSSEDKTYGGQN